MQQRIVGCDGSIGIYFQSHHDSFNVQIRRKQVIHLFIGIKVDIDSLFITLLAEFLHQPCLANLASTFDY